eukprot:12934013-Prorocentrum_lima.AAC.1
MSALWHRGRGCLPSDVGVPCQCSTRWCRSRARNSCAGSAAKAHLPMLLVAWSGSRGVGHWQDPFAASDSHP